MDSPTTASVIFFLFSVFSLSEISIAVDTISVNQQITGNETIISPGGSFELGFFSPGSSNNWYLGIWYEKVATGTVAWVANRDLPLSDSSGVLTVTDQGNLVLLNGTTIIWSSNSSSSSSRSVYDPKAELLESGNLVVRNGNDTDPENYLWQSFDHPTSTLLPGMKLGKNLVTGLNRYLSSWKSADDPAIGNYSYVVDAVGMQAILMRGSEMIFRTGPWVGTRFSGIPELRTNPVFDFDFVYNDEEVYYTFELVNASVVSRLELSPSGSVQRLVWIDRTQGWTVYNTAEKDDCDVYATCGGFGACNTNDSPMCGCVKGFVPRFPSQWNSMDWSGGCERRTALDCPSDGFLKFAGIKLPDTRNSKINTTMNIKECRSTCSRTCSCTAYSGWNISEGGSGCILWFDNVTDIKKFAEDGQDLFVRLAKSEIDAYASSSEKKKRRLVISIPVTIVAVVLLALLISLYILRKKKKEQLKRIEGSLINLRGSETNERQEALDLPLLSFATICSATNNFSIDHKLGQGGFGSVFKGVLQDGKEIAVKRLSKTSKQGLQEFKNEVGYVSKLQHRNLVKLLGCSIHEEERMLIYEYMPNRSLDSFLFDELRSMVLDWHKRFIIINGVARGLLYLHQDSRLRIIHRDLKADNILLDSEMNPKISDFGIAKSFGGDETEASTKRVVGTYGYMSPEYAAHGVYSVKSDVFSFGVIVLEIVTGKRNRGFHHSDHNLDLLGHAWKLYKEGKYLKLIDKSMGTNYNPSEVLRSIKVGLLCVQRFPDDRPNMSSVVQMLGSDGALSEPKEPSFFIDMKKIHEGNSSSSNHPVFSGNEGSMTFFEAR